MGVHRINYINNNKMEQKTSEEIQMLKEATFEIKSLRRQNELMRARLDMFDAMNAILHTQVATRNEGMSPDLVWQIEKYVASKESEGKV